MVGRSGGSRDDLVDASGLLSASLSPRGTDPSGQASPASNENDDDMHPWSPKLYAHTHRAHTQTHTDARTRTHAPAT